jgi:AraC-like DNA-binding protein
MRFTSQKGAKVPLDEKHIMQVPSSGGLLTRLACARIREAGIELAPLLKRARLTARQIDEPGARLAVRSQIRFVDLAADSLGDQLLGFHVAQDLDLREIGLLYYVMASSDTIGEAIRRVVRYGKTANEGIAAKYLDDDDAAIVYKYVGVARHSDRHQIEAWVTIMVRICRQLAGQHVVPTRVTLAHHRHEGCSEINAYLGTAVTFGSDVDELVFSRSVRDMSVVSADSYLNKLLIGYCEEALARRAPYGRVVPSDIENAIASLLPHGTANVDEVARRLGMSRRTLARRLAAQGLTFSQVLNRLRSDLAQRHIRDSDLSISQIAWLLGYQEVSALTHAFKRWTGKTPREMRTREGVEH